MLDCGLLSLYHVEFGGAVQLEYDEFYPYSQIVMHLI